MLTLGRNLEGLDSCFKDTQGKDSKESPQGTTLLLQHEPKLCKQETKRKETIYIFSCSPSVTSSLSITSHEDTRLILPNQSVRLVFHVK